MSALRPITRTAPPLPGRAVAAQRWSDLTFLHWRIDPAEVAPLLPEGVVPDVFDGTSWVGLIPFQLDQATLLGGPALPYVSSFVEVNVRLYGVDALGRRGVVFRSLEASRLVAVLAARATFGLPYFWSRTSMRREGRTYGYDAARIGSDLTNSVRVRLGPPIRTGPLADFLTARWGMFTRLAGRTRWVPNEHEPWRLQAAELLDLHDELVAAAGFPGLTDRRPDSVLFSPGVTTRFGMPARD